MNVGGMSCDTSKLMFPHPTAPTADSKATKIGRP
jgi:hypothetical protein